MSFWMIITVVLLGYALVASIYLALDGFVNLPKHREFIEHPAFWFPLIFAIIVIVAMMSGEISRGDISPLPWEAFTNTKGGISESVFALSLVVVADLWLLWIPANIWVNSRSGLDKQKKYMARAINLLIGLMLMTENNPIMKLFGVFFGGEGIEP